MIVTKFYVWYRWANDDGESSRMEYPLPGPTRFVAAVVWLINQLDHVSWDSPYSTTMIEAVVESGVYNGRTWEARVPVTIR